MTETTIDLYHRGGVLTGIHAHNLARTSVTNCPRPGDHLLSGESFLTIHGHGSAGEDVALFISPEQGEALLNELKDVLRCRYELSKTKGESDEHVPSRVSG